MIKFIFSPLCRIAKELKNHLPEASDEELYQSARRLVVAQMQNVVYGQWLREVVSPRLYEDHNLDPVAGTPNSMEKQCLA